MSVDFHQVMRRIREMAGQAAGDRQALQRRRDLASQILTLRASHLDELRARLDQAVAADSNLRCAIPLNEALDASFPLPDMPEEVTLVAADGSQVSPDRHSSLMYSLVNVGAIIYQHGSGQAPETSITSDLKVGDELLEGGSLPNPELIALDRDLAERHRLLELVEGLSQPLVALTDGTLELWGPKQSSPQAYRRALEAHLSILDQLRDKSVTVAGLVDKPGANLVVTLLEVDIAGDGELKELSRHLKLKGVSDRWLFQNLPSGCRSAVFGLQSNSRVHYQGELSLHFFYINTGVNGNPSLVRVEIPAWVAHDPARVDLLHAAIISQCRILGDIPYPYLLHRAHELAVVTQEDKLQVEQMLVYELHQAGLEVELASNKSRLKGMPKRGRIR